MQNKVGLVSFLALALVLYLIWQDPSGTADMVSGFGGAVGGFFGDLWDKVGEFITSLVGD